VGVLSSLLKIGNPLDEVLTLKFSDIKGEKVFL